MNIVETIAIKGANSTRMSMTASRIRWMILFSLVAFSLICGRLIQLGNIQTQTTIEGKERSLIEASRPAILDRNGMEMAIDIRVPSLFAEPRLIVDVGEAVRQLLSVFPEMDPDWLSDRLTGTEGFIWIRREISPTSKDRVMRLGIPGVDVLTESKRFYPGGAEASHILGTVNIDSEGIAGLEKDIDERGVAVLQGIGLARGQTLEPIRLSIDMRVQHAMYAELTDALTRYQALATAGVVLNSRTGEVIAMVSLPDFNPNLPASALKEGTFNRITAGNFELGSVFKSVTFAAALDSRRVSLLDRFDASAGVRFGRFSINDFHGQNRVLSVPEIYTYSSNVGTIRMMQALGKDDFRAFLSRVGFDAPLVTELPERTRPNVPKAFSEVTAATASFGHGLGISPLHLAAAMAAFMNDGMYIVPTFYPRTETQASEGARRVISSGTADLLRYLMRLNATGGSGSRMEALAKGYRVGGKTGTAEKVVNGRYSSSANLNSFASAFPMENPEYVMFVLVDEPKAENPQSGATAGFNAGEVTGRIIARIAPMLGIAPDFNAVLDAQLTPGILSAPANSAMLPD